MMKRFTDQLRWKFSLYAGFIACVAYLPIVVMDADLGETDYWFAILMSAIILLLVAFTFLFTRAWKTSLSIILAIAAVMGVSLTLLLFSHQIRTAERWSFHASRYKQQVLARAAPAQGDYRHIEWDGWAGSDTVQYLVYDPQDRIAVPGGGAIMLNGKPCGVGDVRRLEKAWYLVTSFTVEDWSSCR